MRASLSPAALAGAILLLLPCASQAYLIQTFSGPRGPVQQHWGADRISYYIDAAGTDDMEPAAAIDLLRSSFQVWESVPTCRISFDDRGVVSGSTPRSTDRVNLIIFDETGAWLEAPPETGIIALTRINSDANTGKIIDADIIFNGRDHRFGTGRTDRVELADVAVHEIGHLLGLEHTPLDGAAAVRPTMNPYYRGDGPGEARTLEADDVAGISSLYPTAAFTAGTATVTGRVTDQEEAPVFGAHIVAVTAAGGGAIGTVTGAYPWLGDAGTFSLAGLPPGAYYLRLAPVDGAVTEENFSGIFHDFSTGFPGEYYDNAADQARATALSVAAGERLTGIDFTTGLVHGNLPYVADLLEPTNTPDSLGPYAVRLRLLRTERAVLQLRYDEGAIAAVPMEHAAGDTFVALIPGQPAGTRISYRVDAFGGDGLRLTYPSEDAWADFEVISLSGAALVFTAVRDEDVVSIFDTGLEREVARVRAGDEPIQVVATPGGDAVFVSNLASSEITVIDAATLQVRARLRAGDDPLDLAVSPDGRTAYVANSGEGSVTAIDVTTGAATTHPVVGIAAGPYGIAVAGPGKLVYLTDLGADQVVAVDGTGAVVTRIPVVDQPRSLAATPDGRRLYVTSFATGRVSVIDAVSNQVTATLSLPVAGTFAVAVSPDGSRTYLTSHSDDAVLAIDARTDTLMAAIALGSNPRALSFTASGDSLLVTSASSGQVHLLRVADNQLLGSYATGAGPRGVAAVPALWRGAAVTAVPSAPRPVTFELEPAYPNPFNAGTSFAFTLRSEDGGAVSATLAVHNVLGQRLRTLVQGPLATGRHLSAWDGLDEDGRDVGSGTYLVRLSTPGGQAVGKVLLLR
ncbi:MAG: beta-propeller fold lactonase family protein [Gemmatimonadota bacterium]